MGLPSTGLAVGDVSGQVDDGLPEFVDRFHGVRVHLVDDVAAGDDAGDDAGHDERGADDGGLVGLDEVGDVGDGLHDSSFQSLTGHYKRCKFCELLFTKL